MQRRFVRIFLSAVLSAACLSSAFADRSVAYTVTMPHYFQDGVKLVGTPTFVVHGEKWTKFTSGTYLAFETAEYPTKDYFKCKDLSAGYYASKWEILTSGGRSLFTGEDEMAGIEFPYEWYKRYGDSQLRLIVSIVQKQYTVSYDTNGGDWNGAEPEPKSYDYNKGDVALSRTAAVRDGHTLTGWNTMPDGSGTAVGFGAAFTGKTFGITAKANDIVLYAQWSAKSYSATIAAGEGGSGSSQVSYSYSEGQQTKVISLPTREGHSLSGWTASGYSGSMPTIQGNVLTIPAKTSGNFTMTPTWKANTYTLRVEKGVGIYQIDVNYVRDGMTRYDTTSYGTTFSVDYGTAWSAYAVAAEGYSTNATCAASGTMTTAGALFSPTASCNDYSLRLSLGEGIATIWYRVGVSSEWSWTTNNLSVPVAFNATWQAYAEAAEGYEYTATSREYPASGKMTAAGAAFEPVGTVKSYVLRLELTPGIEKICYKVGEQAYYDETTANRSVPVPYGTVWDAYALAVAGCTTNETCAASGTMGAGGAVFRPRVNAKPYPLQLTLGTGIAKIFYKTNESQAAWCSTDREAAVPVLFGDTWSAYAVAVEGYTYAKTSEAMPKTGVMTTAGDEFAPTAAPNAIWVRYERNGGGDAGRMDDSEFTYGVEAPLRLNAYARSYEIHYNGNGGTCAHENDVSGYTFTDWRDTAEGLTGTGHYSYSDGDRVKNPCGSTGAPARDPVILYAQWKPKAVVLPLPERAGYDFSGWYTLREGGQRVGGAGDSYAATDDITLFAHWRAHVTKLAFRNGDALVEGEGRTVRNGEKHAAFGELPVLTSADEKKTFDGWYDKPEGEEGAVKITDETVVAWTDANVTLYAHWVDTEYAIDYETGGGTIDGYYKTSYKPGETFQLPTVVTREVGEFEGWYDNPRYEGDRVSRISSSDRGDKAFYSKWSEPGNDVNVVYADVASEDVIYAYTTNTTLEAVWRDGEYIGVTNKQTVTSEVLYTNLAVNAAFTNTYAYGAQVTLEKALFFRTGYTQTGWKEGGKTCKLGQKYGSVNQDHVFSAIWDVNTYTIVYDGNGDEVGGLAYDRNIPYGETRTLYSGIQAGIKKTGYDFIGWAMSKDGHVVYDASHFECKEKVVNLTDEAGGVVTLYAVWEKKNAEVPVVKSAPKLAAAPSVASSPTSVVTPEQPVPSDVPTFSTFSTLSASQPTYTLHFSPDADVVNPMAMTNWEHCVSGAAIMPDCLYTNLYSDGFAGWIYDGQTNKTVVPVAAFDGQIITVQAAWKEYVPGLYSDAVGLKNVMLTCRLGSEWARQTTGGVDKEKPACLLAQSDKDRVLNMQVNGPGRITYCWRYDTADAIASNIVDGVATAIVSSKTWEEKTLDVAGDGSHLITWFVPAKQPVNLPYFFIDKVRWDPTPRQYAITTAAEPDVGGSTMGDGSYASGATATLVATPANGYMFVQWNDGSTDQAHKVTVWGDITNYVATFKTKTCTVTGAAIPSEGGSVAGGGTYAVGTTVTLVAQPTDEHWTFTQWTDGVTAPSRQITVSADVTYTALFTNQYEITGVAMPSEGGTVTGGGRYKVGTAVTLTAVPKNDDWAFVKWNDDYPSAERSVTVTKDETYAALFTNQYLVTVSATPTEGGMVTGGGRYVVGTDVTLSATANDGYAFERWSDGSTDVNHTITVLCTTNLMATFSGSGPGPGPGPGPTPVTTNYYYIAFDGNGATSGAMGEQTNVCGEAAVLNLNAFGKKGHTFVGWQDKKGKTYADGATVTDLATTNRAALLKAVWGVNVYNVQFDACGGVGTMERSDDIPYDVSYKLPACAFTKTGCAFAGWSRNPKATTPEFADSEIVCGLSDLSGTITLYAVWNENAKIQAFVDIAGRTATRHYSGRVQAVDGYDAIVRPMSDKVPPYYIDDFAPTGDVARATGTDVGTYKMNLTANSFKNLNVAYEVKFEVADGWLKILPSQVGGEPEAATGSKLSAFDSEGTYGKPFDGSAISNAYVQAGYGVTQVEYAATEGGPWSTNAPIMAVVGATSIWYRVSATGYEPYAHELAVKVAARSIGEATVEIADQVWTGKPLTPEAKVSVDEKALAEGTDYYLTYADNTDPGEATAYVHGRGNWTGMVAAHFNIVKEITDEPGPGVVPPGGLSKFDVAAVYDGTPHTVDAEALTNAYAATYAGARVAFGETKEGPWEANPILLTEAGATSFWYRVTANCCKPYVHEVQVTVAQRTGVEVRIVGHIANCIYDGTEQTASGYEWQANDGLYTAQDFRCMAETVAVRRNVGTTCAGLTAESFENLNGNFAGVRFIVERDVAVTIAPAERTDEPGPGMVPPGGASKFDVTAEYDGAPHTFDIVALTNAFVEEGCAVTNLMYALCQTGPWAADPIAIVDVGTTSFWYRADAENYKPFAHEAKVTVMPRDLANVTIAPISDQTWTGKPIEPPVTVTDGRPSIVTVADYDVAYADNVEIGTATVSLTGKRNYVGTKTANFAIVEKVLPRALVTITGHTVTAAYDGKSHTASDYDYVSTNGAYTAKDFRCTAVTSVTRTELGTSVANLTAADFENLNPEFAVEFVVARDISVTVTTGTISGEPGAGKVPAGGLSKYDATYVYDGEAHTLDVEALTNAFAAAYVVTNVEYAATAGGPWTAEPPAISDAGATSFWYRVSCENYEPFAHQAKVTVTPCATVVVRITGHVATNVYDGLPHRVEGYDVSIAGSPLYGEDDFAFAGRDYAERTKPGVTRYEMKVADFRNVNGNFKNVKFVIVRDGESAVVWDEPPFGVGEVGRYYGYTLFELGFVDLADAVSVKAEGLPAGLALKKANVNGYWYVEGVPTAAASTNDGQCAYLRITRKVGTAKVEEVVELPIEVREARVREIAPPAVLNEAYESTPIDELWPEVAEAVEMPKDWSFTGWPTGIKYTTRDVVKQAEAYDVYGKATKAGVFTVTATRTVTSLFTTAKYKEKYYASFMTEPEEGAGIAYTCRAYMAIDSVAWADVKSVSGLPTGLKYGSVKGGVEVYGTPTKAGCFVVTRTYADRTKDTLLWQVLPGENGGATVDFGGSKVEAGIVQVELGLPVVWPLTADAGAKVTVSGLPTGLRFKDGEISGVPTKAANYTVTVKTVANGVTVTQRFAVKATALPAYMVGTYYGAATNALGTAEQFTLTLGATGKVSGNFYVKGSRVAFSAASLDRRAADGGYVATIAYTYNRVKYADELVLATTNAVEGVDLWQVSLFAAGGVLAGVDAQRDAAKAVGGVTAGSYPVMEKTAAGEYLTAKVTAAGVVTVSGKLLNETTGKLVAVSCSTRLMVLEEDRFGCWITIYKKVGAAEIKYVRFWELD